MFQVLILFFLFASIFSIGKITLESSTPIFITAVRMFIAGVFLILIQYFKNYKKETRSNNQFVPIFILAFFGYYITNILEFWGLKYVTSSKACFIYSLSPFVSALFSYVLFKDVITKKKWLGMLIGIIGFIPFFMSEDPGEQTLRHFFVFSWAEFALLLACISSVIGWVVTKKVLQTNSDLLLDLNGKSMLLAGIFCFIHSYFVDHWNPLPILNYHSFLINISLLLLISNLICHNLYGHLLKRFTITFMSFAGLLTPLFSLFWGKILLQEEVKLSFFISLFFVGIGLSIFYQDELKQGIDHKDIKD